MSAAEELVGKTVPGRRVTDQWDIIERIVPPRTGSNGCRSVGYKVRSSSGRNAFMKAADLQILTNETAGFFERLEAAVVAQRFERNMLDHCRGNNMDRVVVALDYGEVEIVNDNVRDVVFYLIFELAKCDARVQLDKNRRFNLTWALNTLRNLAIAINQLHSGDVCHNDIKPSNVLVFDTEKQKLADLGCATSPLVQAMHDCLPVAGDPRYAAPEMLYMPAAKPGMSACSFDARRAGCTDRVIA